LGGRVGVRTRRPDDEATLMSESNLTVTTGAHDAGKAGRRSTLLFAGGIGVLVAACLFAGATAGPALGRWRAARALGRATEGDIAVVLEHAAIDVRLGRGPAALETLRRLGPQVRDAATRERYLALTADAALQAGQLALVESSERERAALVTEPAAKRAIGLRRIGLLAALKQKPQAEALAKEVAAARPSWRSCSSSGARRRTSACAPRPSGASG
jgi:hypothetical protein